MARQTRIHLPGGVYHVTLRGHEGKPILFADEDPVHFEALIAEGVARFGHLIHAYCWTDNEAHLAVQAGQEPLSKSIQNLAFRHTRWINRRERRFGPLFQGRFRAVLIDADAYLLALVRQLHLLPVRAGLVADPAGHPWSSHRAYLGLRETSWLTTDRVLSLFSGDAAKARGLYAEFVAEGLADARREDFYRGKAGGRFLGSEEFIQQALNQASQTAPTKVRLDAILTAVCAARRLDWETLRSPSRGRAAADARALVAYLVAETRAVTLTRAAELLNRDVATLSNAANRTRDRLRVDSEFAAEVNRLRKILEIEAKMKA